MLLWIGPLFCFGDGRLTVALVVEKSPSQSPRSKSRNDPVGVDHGVFAVDDVVGWLADGIDYIVMLVGDIAEVGFVVAKVVAAVVVEAEVETGISFEIVEFESYSDVVDADNEKRPAEAESLLTVGTTHLV